MNVVNCDPLRCLPYELWVKCIRFYVREQPAGALPLLSVSSNWQSHLLETQELWDTIYLDGGHDELCRAECFFHLSRDLPIELVLDSKSNAVDIVIKYRDRINSLIFYTRYPNNWYTSEDIRRHARGLEGHRYPNINHICVESLRYEEIFIPSNLIEACPALIGIHGAYIGQETISILPASITNVGVFTSRALPEGFADRLEVLRVRNQFSEAQKASFSRYFTAPSICLTSFELDYGFWRQNVSPGARGPPFDTLQYLPPLEGFTSAIHQGLKVLSITMPWYEISRLVPVLSTSTALRELELIIDPAIDQPQPRDIPPLTISDIGHIRKLSMYIHPGRSSWVQFFAPNLRRFLKLFIDGNALEHLKELHLEFVGYNYAGTFNLEVLGLLRMGRNLTELHLIGTRLTGTESTKILLNSLHTLVGRLSIMQYLETPNLACLIDNNPSDRFYDSQTLPSTETLESVTIPAAETLESVTVPASMFFQWNDAVSKAKSIRNTFPQLKRLELFTENASPNPLVTPDFSNLQSIAFEDPIYFSPKSGIMGRYLNHFILEVLLSPAICPNLRTIRATMYPIWALTIAMLHRRNSLKTVTTIRSLWLPGYPQISILSSLCQVLDTPMEDGSANMDTVSRVDRAINLRWELDFFRRQACRSCIGSGYIACQPYQNEPTEGKPPTDPAIDLLYLNSGATMASKLETFTLNEWKMYLNETVIPNIPNDPCFKRTCDRHDLEILVHIGPHTLAGVTHDLF